MASHRTDVAVAQILTVSDLAELTGSQALVTPRQMRQGEAGAARLEHCKWTGVMRGGSRPRGRQHHYRHQGGKPLLQRPPSDCVANRRTIALRSALSIPRHASAPESRQHAMLRAANA
jgi:hypothetical protein